MIVLPAVRRPAPALPLLAGAAGLGVSAHLCFHYLQDGLAQAAALAALVAFLAAADRLGWLRVPAADRALAGPGLVAIVPLLLWRDAELLLALDLLAAALLLGLLVRARRGIAARADAVEFLARPAVAVGHAVAGAPRLLAALAREMRGTDRRALALAGAGILLAAPVVLLFGLLLASADPAFEALLGSVLGLDAAPLQEHVLPAAALAWVSAGYLVALGLPLGAVTSHGGRAGRTDALVPTAALSAIALLFVLFLAVQASALFGGTGYLLRTPGLTAAQYARGGFFQLVAVTAMTLPLLLLAERQAAPAPDGQRRLRRVMQALLVLLALLLADAAGRMATYVRAFGMTEDRLLCLVVMAWLALALGWFAATVLRGRRARFASGALAAGLAVLAALHVADPDRLIATVNLDRAASGRPLDPAYLAGLGAGGARVAIARLGDLPAAERCALAHALGARWSSGTRERRWSLQRRALVARDLPVLERQRAAWCG